MTRRVDWDELLRTWEVQQEAFNPDREWRFRAMLDVVAALLPPRFHALDLGAGPGSLSARLLRRFPSARVVAIDYDPVTRRIGQGALGSYGGRLTWVDATLARRAWSNALPKRRYTGALSTTALHWLTAAELRRFYFELGRLLPRGAVFLNGDYIPWNPHRKGLVRLTRRLREIRESGSPLRNPWAPWERWWRDAQRIPELKPFFTERARRTAEHPHHREVPIDVHVRALRSAGFREVEILWQVFGNRLLFAQR